MFVRHKLPSASKFFKRLLFQYRGVVGNVIQNLGLHDEKTAVDPSPISLWFFQKSMDTVGGIKLQGAKPARRLDRGDRCQLAMSLVIGQQFSDVDVSYAISIGKQKRFVSQIFLNTLNPPASHG